MRAIRLCAILITAAAVCAAALGLSTRTAFECGGSYTFYVGSASSNCRIVTVNGNAALTKLTLKDVCGEATTFATLDIARFLDSVNGEIIFEERLSDSVNYYCAAELPYSVNLYGREINLHICVGGSGVTVASPIIFGGY